MRMTTLQPKGFFSYTRQDDEAQGKILTKLRKLIQSELQVQYGRGKIDIFQDTEVIEDGVDFPIKTKAAMNEVSFFIPILTPNFVESEWCCKEITMFLEREQEILSNHPELSREQRLIWPIQLIDTSKSKPYDPDAIAALANIQTRDFRELRFAIKGGTRAVHSQIAQFATSISDVLRTEVTAIPTAEELAEQKREQERLARVAREEANRKRRAAKKEADRVAAKAASDKLKAEAEQRVIDQRKAEELAAAQLIAEQKRIALEEQQAELATRREGVVQAELTLTLANAELGDRSAIYDTAKHAFDAAGEQVTQLSAINASKAVMSAASDEREEAGMAFSLAENELNVSKSNHNQATLEHTAAQATLEEWLDSIGGDLDGAVEKPTTKKSTQISGAERRPGSGPEDGAFVDAKADLLVQEKLDRDEHEPIKIVGIAEEIERQRIADERARDIRAKEEQRRQFRTKVRRVVAWICFVPLGLLALFVAIALILPNRSSTEAEGPTTSKTVAVAPAGAAALKPMNTHEAPDWLLKRWGISGDCSKPLIIAKTATGISLQFGTDEAADEDIDAPVLDTLVQTKQATYKLSVSPTRGSKNKIEMRHLESGEPIWLHQC